MTTDDRVVCEKMFVIPSKDWQMKPLRKGGSLKEKSIIEEKMRVVRIKVRQPEKSLKYQQRTFCKICGSIAQNAKTLSDPSSVIRLLRRRDLCAA